MKKRNKIEIIDFDLLSLPIDCLDLTVKLTKMEHSAQGKKIRGARCKMSKHLGADAKLPFF